MRALCFSAVLAQHRRLSVSIASPLTLQTKSELKVLGSKIALLEAKLAYLEGGASDESETAKGLLKIELRPCEDQLQTLMLQLFNAYINTWKRVTNEAKREKEKRQLRDEEKLLRDEEKLLRDKEKQLRDKEKQLLQPSEKGSLYAPPGAYFIGGLAQRT